MGILEFERKNIKDSLDIGIRNYPHVVRAYIRSNNISRDFPLDDLEEFLKSTGKKYSGPEFIRITAVDPDDTEKMHEYWKEGGKLPETSGFHFLSQLQGENIVVRGKIYKVP